MLKPNAYRNESVLVVLSLLLILVVSCAHQPEPFAASAPGFFSGLVHGFSMPFSFIIGLVSDVRIYDFPNSGGGYDFGYLIGATVFSWSWRAIFLILS